MYTPGALKAVADCWIRKHCGILSGNALFIDEHGRSEGRFFASKPKPSGLLSIRSNTVPQQGTFWSHECWNKFGPLSEDVHFAMDYEFWIKLSTADLKWEILEDDLALFRHHPEQKTANIPSNVQRLGEKRRILQRFRQTSLCKKEHLRHIRRGLDEIWVKEWKIKHRKFHKGMPFWLYWACAPLQNWRCLCVPAYYGFLYYRMTRSKGHIFEQNS
jgi:hypothetical protein